MEDEAAQESLCTDIVTNVVTPPVTSGLSRCSGFRRFGWLG
jgi:hypothetical protein